MVMHARKPQRMSDGFFEKHQTHPYQSSKYSKRDYERETSRSSNYRDRADSPSSSGGLGGSGNGGSASMNNGSFRSQSRELDSPPRHEFRDRDRGDRPSYLQKMRDRDRDVYKKDKYSDKRDRRGSDRESEHRTNHDRLDRRSKLCLADKHSGSDDRDRDRERDRDRDIRESKRDRGGSERDRNDRDRGDRDRDRDRDRNDRDRERDRDRNDRGTDRITRIGDWSEHVSSSGKMYYYNCKTEVSQWEKPKEWLEKERSLIKDQHREREYREKERERDREDRFSRSTAAYIKHSSSRDNSRQRWQYENEISHRRRHEAVSENPDMDISPGDSTPTSEASYSLTGTPTTQLNEIAVSNVGSANSVQQPQQPVLLANALPRVASHPPVASNSQMHFAPSQPAVIIGSNTNSSGSSSNSSICGTTSSNSHRSKLDSIMQQSNITSVSSPTNAVVNATSNHLIHHQQQQQQPQHLHHTQVAQQSSIIIGNPGEDHHLNSIAPGPPTAKLVASAPTIANSNIKSLEQVDLNPQKVLLRQAQQPQSHHGILSSMQVACHDNQVLSSPDPNNATNNVNLRENPLNSPLYNLSHGMSAVNHTKSQLNVVTSTCSTQMLAVNSSSTSGQYTCNSAYGVKTVEAASSSLSASGGAIGLSGTSLGSISSLTNVSIEINTVTTTVVGGGGPPTPTQELDISSSSTDQRKLEPTSASLSSLQSCVTSCVSSAAGRSQGPEISPKLAKYFRPDLITHVTNWPAEILEKQAQECSKETHMYGDIQCTRVSAELKCARSLVRVTEIQATLQEQKIMYLRQQIRRLEELKSQNSFMSDDL